MTAIHFGVEVDQAHWEDLAAYAAGRSIAILPQFQRWIDAAAEIAAEKHFFHWELEFPEVFFDRQGRLKNEEAGFDAVVGNPPYVSVTNIGKADREYLLRTYSTATGRFDLYIAFLDKGLQLVRSRGYFWVWV